MATAHACNLSWARDANGANMFEKTALITLAHDFPHPARITGMKAALRHARSPLPRHTILR